MRNHSVGVHDDVYIWKNEWATERRVGKRSNINQTTMKCIQSRFVSMITCSFFSFFFDLIWLFCFEYHCHHQQKWWARAHAYVCVRLKKGHDIKKKINFFPAKIKFNQKSSVLRLEVTFIIFARSIFWSVYTHFEISELFSFCFDMPYYLHIKLSCKKKQCKRRWQLKIISQKSRAARTNYNRWLFFLLPEKWLFYIKSLTLYPFNRGQTHTENIWIELNC